MDRKDQIDKKLAKADAIEIGRGYIQYLIQCDFPVRKAYLYGSYARGNFNEDSDIDIAVFLENLQDPFQTQVEMLKLTWKIDTRIEPHPFDESDFSASTPFMKSIKQYGVEIPTAS